jgi:membrane-associated PAP2 superfamily phosphatase
MKSLLNNKSHNKSIVTGIALIVLSLWMQPHRELDYFIQSLFFNFSSKTWLIYETPHVRMLWYTLPKILLGIVCVILIALRYKTHDPLKLRKISAFLFCMAFIPLVISFIKSKTNVHCPNDLADFNGRVPFRSIFDFSSYKEILKNYGNGNCFPGGHASGGYAFMSAYLVVDEKYKAKAIGLGFILGTFMASYQTFKGAHFLSHTLFTFGFAILIISAVDSWLWRKL